MKQHQFQAAILDPDQPVPDGLLDGQGRPAGRRFSVYRNNVAVSLTEALMTGFPVVTKLLGDENFKAIAGVFLRLSPPKSALMMHYGSGFPEFLQSFEPVKHLGYLHDIATLELAMRQSYHAADAEAIAPETLQQIAPDALGTARFSFSPALRLLCSPWPIYGIWAFNMLEGAPSPAANAQDVLIVRSEFDPEPNLLGAGAAACFRALARGDTLDQAIEAATKDSEAFDFAAFLTSMLQSNAISKINLEATE